MKALVTGGCGFIGSAVIRYGIRNTEHQIINVDKLTYAATPEALEETSSNARYSFERADICETDNLRVIFDEHRPDIVIHLAAETHVDRSIDGPAEFVRTNIFGTFSLLQAARFYFETLSGAERENFRLLHVSTDEVFGSLALGDASFTEASSYRPNSPYSASKAGADHFVSAWGHTFGLPVITSNCSNNYGPWQFPEKLIPLMILRARLGETLPVYGKGENIRDWLHVDDHAAAIWEVIKHGQVGERYLIGGNAEHRNIDVVMWICEAMDERFPNAAPHARLIQSVQDRAGHDLRYAIDSSKLQNEIGWSPSHDFRSGLVETVDWYLQNESWWRTIRKRTYAGQRLGIVKRMAS